MQGEIVAIGAANIDSTGRSRNPLVAEDSNPGRITTTPGGVSRNICENLARLGLPVRLITTVGDDENGRRILTGCRDCGINTDSVTMLAGERSSCYLSVHRPSGEMAVAVSDMSILQKLSPSMVDRHEKIIRSAAAVVIDGGLPERTLRHVITVYGPAVPIFADTVSTSYARKFLRCRSGIHTIKPNRLEAEVLSGMPIRSEADFFAAGQRIVAKGARRVVISAGARGCFYSDAIGQALWARTRPIGRIRSATGAGDGFMAGLLYGFYMEFDIFETLDFAMGCAIAALRAPGAINGDLSPGLVRETVKEFGK